METARKKKKKLKLGAFPAGTEMAVIREFSRLSATSPRTARRLSDVGVVDAPGAQILISRELLRPADSRNEKYYLDFEHYARIRRWKLLRLIAGVVAAVALLAVLMSLVLRVD